MVYLVFSTKELGTISGIAFTFFGWTPINAAHFAQKIVCWLEKVHIIINISYASSPQDSNQVPLRPPKIPRPLKPHKGLKIASWTYLAQFSFVPE